MFLPVPRFPPDILDQFPLTLEEPDQRLVLTRGSVLVEPGVRPLGVIELSWELGSRAT